MLLLEGVELRRQSLGDMLLMLLLLLLMLMLQVAAVCRNRPAGTTFSRRKRERRKGTHELVRRACDNFR